MSNTSDNKKKRFATGDTFTDNFLNLLNEDKLLSNEAPEPEPSFEAPVVDISNPTWFKGSDGNFLDKFKATTAKVQENLMAGILGVGEKVVDAGAYIAGGVGGLFGNDEFMQDMQDFIAKDLYDEKKVAQSIQKITSAPIIDKQSQEEIDRYSVLGEKTEGLIQSGGQLLATAALKGVAIPWFVTSGVTSFGGEAEAAFNEGATYAEAGISAAVTAGAEMLTEKLFGGSGLGEKGIINVDKLTKGISNKVVKTLLDYGIDIGTEGFEEVGSQFISTLGQQLTYEKEDTWETLLSDEKAMDAYIAQVADSLFGKEAREGYGDAFIGGAALGGVANVGKVAQNIKKKTDYRTGLTKAEEAVVDKVYNDRLKNLDGNKVTAKDKAALRNEVINDLANGGISIDDIESVLGGDTYTEYQNTIENENALQKEYDELYKMKNSEKSDEQIDRQAELKEKLEEIKSEDKRTQLKTKLSQDVFNLAKDSKLSESYAERARRGQKFEADISGYDEKQQPIIQKAIDSGILNNTRRTHEFVDLVAKISVDKNVSFDFLNNKKLKNSGFAVDGAMVNGYIDKASNTIVVNIDSKKALNSVVGHEISHVLEGTELYGELQNAAFEYAKTKGEYDSRREALAKLYAEEAIDEEMTADLVGDYLFTDQAFVDRLSTNHRNIFQKIYDEIKYLCKIATAGSKEARELEKVKRMFEKAYRESGKVEGANGNVQYSRSDEVQTLKSAGLEYDANSKTVFYSKSSLEDAFNYHTDESGVIINENDYIKARTDYVDALAKSIAEDKGNPTSEEKMKASKYLDGLFLIHDMIAADKDRLDYEAAVNKSSWVSNSEYGGSIDFSTLCAKRRLFTGTFDAIQNELPDTVLNENDFLRIRDMLLEKDLESPCSMCYVEGSRAKHGVYVDKWLKEYLATDPEWKPQIADFTSSTRLEKTRIEHPEAYAEYQKAMNKLAQRKPKEASVRTDYKGEILVAFEDGSSVEIKNQNGGIRFNSFSDFEIIHALDCMQVITDMARVGLNGQAYTKVKEFAESFGGTGLKINLSLVAKDVDANGKLIMDEVNGMKYSEAMDIRNKYSDNVGTVIVVFNDTQLKAALEDSTIDFVLPFHRSQWKKSQYAMMGLPTNTKDYTALQNDRIRNPNTGKPVKLSRLKQTITYTNDITGETYVINDNIMPNMYWDYSKNGRENANRYLDYINANGMIPKFDFLLDKVDGKWVLPEGRVGDSYFKLLIDFKMYNNDGWGAPQTPVLPEFNMPYIQQMLDNYVGGHQSFPVAYDVVDKFVKGKKEGRYSLSEEGTPNREYGDWNIYGEDIGYNLAPETAPTVEAPTLETEANLQPDVPTPVAEKTPDLFESSSTGQMTMVEESKPKGKAETKPKAAPTSEPKTEQAESESKAPDDTKERKFIETATGSEAVDGMVTPDDIPDDVRYYKVKANKDTLAAANNRLAKDGYAKSREHFKGRMSALELTVEDIALGERLIQEAAKTGDAEAVRDLIIDVSILGTELGQKVQALSMIRRLTPEGQLMALTRVVERGKAKGDKAFDGVEVTKKMTETILKTKNKDGTFDQAKLNAAVEDVKQQIADQMKVTKMDKVNAWRYLSMLGNPKTHIRNIFSNIAMFGTRVYKNAVARTIEDIALRNQKPTLNTGENIAPYIIPDGTLVRNLDRGNIGTIKSYDKSKNQYSVFFKSKKGRTATVNIDADKVTELNPKKTEKAPVNYRTRTWKRASDAVKAFAKETTKAEEANIKGDNKYSDQGSIKAKRRIFKNKVLNAVDKFNKNAMEWEDAIFSKVAYKQTLQEYLTANGVKTEADIKNNPELVEAAKDYALEEARRATFRQDSFVADKIAEIERKNPILGVVIGSTMPFKKTPINIAKTGLAYSPLGFARNIYDAVQVKKGNMDVSEAIDHIAQSLTGTSLLVLGFALANLGVLNGAGDYDKEGKYDYQLGEQSYSFTYGGDTFSLSWLSPVAMPLFVGVNLYEGLVEDKEWDADIVFETLGQTLDPLSEMSFLSSLDGVFSSYDSGAEKIMGMGETMAQNYVTQFVPTLSSQLASTLDDTKRSTKPSKNSSFTFGEETMNKVLYKIPGLRNTLEPTTDIWGNEAKQTENFFLRGFESFFSPANKREGIYTAVDEEIKEIYRQTDDSGVIPSIPNNYINYRGEKYELSAKEHTEYKKLYGQTAYDLMADLFDSDMYNESSFEEKAKLVNRVYDYARDLAKQEYFKKYDIAYTNAGTEEAPYYKEDPIKGAIDSDMSIEEFAFYNENPAKYEISNAVGGYNSYKEYTKALSDIESDRTSNGKVISGSRKKKVVDYINNLDIDYGEKLLLYKMEYTADDQYNVDIVEYLNERDDISRRQMITILGELGFTISEEGRVTW